MTSSEIRNPAGERLDHTFHPGLRKTALVVLGHGLTGNKDRPLLIALAEGLSQRNWPCLRLSFSGNGNSEGRFEDSCISKEVKDLQAILDTVPDYISIVYLGHSMGGAVGVMTAAVDRRIRCLVTISGMVHTADFVRREFSEVVPGQGLMWDEPECPLSQTFVDDLNQIRSTLDAAKSVVQPWLLIHGLKDDLVPPQDSRDALAASTCLAKLLEIPDADHTFDQETYPQLVNSIDAWLDSLIG